MKPEDYNPSNYLPQGYYPWPNKINPNVEQMGIDYRNWIDTDYVYLSENIRERYKGMNLPSARQECILMQVMSA